MKLTEMKQLLATRGIRLTKSLGQNFLHDANQLRRIVAAADLKKTDRVLEIGPGLGPLTELLVQEAGRGPQRMVATLQIEVARRLMAKFDTSDYGVLTLLVQADYEPREWFKIPAGCFFPEPDVESACVCLERRPRPLLQPEERHTFVRIVKRSFSQRRKMMLKLLKQDWPAPRLAAEFERLNLSPQIRAEAVSLEQFAQLAQGLLCHQK